MSDPRNSDPRRTDPLRRHDLRAPSSAGTLWTWLAAIVAVVVVLGLIIGYSRTDQASIQSTEPETTGSAPVQRLAPKSGDVPAPPAPASVPSTPGQEPNL